MSEDNDTSGDEIPSGNDNTNHDKPTPGSSSKTTTNDRRPTIASTPARSDGAEPSTPAPPGRSGPPKRLGS